GRPCCTVQTGGRRAGSAAAEKVFEISAGTMANFLSSVPSTPKSPDFPLQALLKLATQNLPITYLI
ncbi:MAG: hypothetical protein WAM17_13425, partial [Rhodoplanes sp.]